MSRLIQEKKIGAGRVVAVAIENNKTSQYAAKWAVDNLLPKEQALLLLYVRQRASSIPTPSNHSTSISYNSLFYAYMYCLIFCDLNDYYECSGKSCTS